jgi:hypothetical protein
MTYRYNSADHINQQQTLKSAAQQASGITQAEKAIHQQQRTRRPNGLWMRSPAGYVVSNSDEGTFWWVRSTPRKLVLIPARNPLRSKNHCRVQTPSPGLSWPAPPARG